MQHLEFNIEKVKQAKLSIEKGIKLEYSTVLETLK